MPLTKFCSYCGREMLLSLAGAETNMMFYGDVPTIPLSGKYDKRTGKRNCCFKYKCPDYKNKKWYEIGGSPHDDYYIDEVIPL